MRYQDDSMRLNVNIKSEYPAFIHSTVDDAPLSSGARSVYMHLCRRAGSGQAWPAYKSIGAACFREYDNPATQRRRAIEAVAELVAVGLILKENRGTEEAGSQSNLYTIIPLADLEIRGGECIALGGVHSTQGGAKHGGSASHPKYSPIEGTPNEGTPAVSSEEDTDLLLPFSDFPAPVAPVESPAAKKKHAAPGPVQSRSSNEAKEIVKAYERVLQEQTPGAIVAWPREVKAATAMVKAGWSEANVIMAYAHMKAQDYWHDKVLHLDKVAEQIAEVWKTLKVRHPELAPAMLKDEPYTIVWKLADGRIVEEQTTVSDAKRRGHYRS